MTRLADTTDRLAIKVAGGTATRFQEELLGRVLLDYAAGAAQAAVSAGLLRPCDADDAASAGALRAYRKLSQFRPGKAGLNTWVSAITRSVVGDIRRRYAREAQYVADDTDASRL